MAHLIDKDALVAEMRKIWDYADEHWDVEYVTGARRFSDKLEDAINALEVKEVDLDKECSQYFEDWTVQDDLGLTKPDGWSCIVKDLYDIAKHFFELGLKAKQD